jgi:hypothetical protein
MVSGGNKMANKLIIEYEGEGDNKTYGGKFVFIEGKKEDTLDNVIVAFPMESIAPGEGYYHKGIVEEFQRRNPDEDFKVLGGGFLHVMPESDEVKDGGFTFPAHGKQVLVRDMSATYGRFPEDKTREVLEEKLPEYEILVRR